MRTAGRAAKWDTAVLERLCNMLRSAADKGEFLWNNQQVVHLFVPGQKQPWATIHTKRPDHVELVLAGPKGEFAQGRVVGLGRESYVDPRHEQYDMVRIRFQNTADLSKGNVEEFLRTHRSSLR